MFAAMSTALVAAFFVALVVMTAAFLSEGRGTHALNVIKRSGAKGLREEAFTTVERDAHDWQLFERLDAHPDNAHR